ATGYAHLPRAVLHRFGGSLLTLGAQGSAVRSIQRALGVRPPSGVYGPRTQAAVIAFQRARGLGVDGIVGPQTWRALAGPAHRRAPHHRGRHHSGPARRHPAPARPGTWARTHHWPSQRAVHRAASTTLQPGASGWRVRIMQRIVRARADGA